MFNGVLPAMSNFVLYSEILTVCCFLTLLLWATKTHPYSPGSDRSIQQGVGVSANPRSDGQAWRQKVGSTRFPVALPLRYYSHQLVLSEAASSLFNIQISAPKISSSITSHADSPLCCTGVPNGERSTNYLENHCVWSGAKPRHILPSWLLTMHQQWWFWSIYFSIVCLR